MTTIMIRPVREYELETYIAALSIHILLVGYNFLDKRSINKTKSNVLWKNALQITKVIMRICSRFGCNIPMGSLSME
jgi:hypothetical protein